MRSALRPPRAGNSLGIEPIRPRPRLHVPSGPSKLKNACSGRGRTVMTAVHACINHALPPAGSLVPPAAAVSWHIPKRPDNKQIGSTSAPLQSTPVHAAHFSRQPHKTVTWYTERPVQCRGCVGRPRPQVRGAACNDRVSADPAGRGRKTPASSIGPRACCSRPRRQTLHKVEQQFQCDVLHDARCCMPGRGRILCWSHASPAEAAQRIMSMSSSPSLDSGSSLSGGGCAGGGGCSGSGATTVVHAA